MSETTTPIKALGEVVLRVRNLDTMQEFYEKAVGLELLARDENTMVFFRIGPGYEGHTQSLALSVWKGQLTEKASSGNIPETKRMLSRFVEKVELGYKKANLWYTYPVDNNVPFRVYSGGGTRTAWLRRFFY